MGGNLAWTIRLEDGTEYRMDRWTNAMPGLILTPGFLAGEPTAIEEALSQWLEMKADWEANKDSGNYKYPMTPVYEPYPHGLKPSEYGAVVTDFQSKTILSLQGYTDLGSVNAVRQCYGPRAAETFPDKVTQLEELARAGMVTSYELLVKTDKAANALLEISEGAEIQSTRRGSHLVTIPGTVGIDELNALCDQVRDDIPPHPDAAKLDEARAEVAKMDDADPEKQKFSLMIQAAMGSHQMEHDPFIFGHARIDLAPFTLEEFDEGADGYEAMLARIRELGFFLSDDEVAGWEERIAYLREEEEEDAAADA